MKLARRVGIVALFVMPLACARTADEPSPHVTATVPSSPVPVATAANVPAGRCVAATPDAPPPAVAPGPAAGCPVDPAPHPLQTVTVEFPTASGDAGKGLRMRAELARRPQDSEKGLMYRTSMPEDHGMLFDLGARDVHTFWMHDTCIPLDMLFIDDDGLIVGIVENAPTLNDAPRGVACPSTHVLEVNAGWSRRHGVRAGDRVVLPGA